MAHGKLYVSLMNSKEWRRLRMQVLSEQPLCERCKAEGYIVAARCVHHIVPVESGRTEAECRDLAFRRNNCQALCYQCHADIHKAERSYTKEVRQQRNDQRLSQWADRLHRMFKKDKGIGVNFTQNPPPAD